LAACLLFLYFDRKPDLIAAFDNRCLDTMFRLRGTEVTTGQIVIINIDEKSLSALGQWPWSRDIVAQLVDNFRRAGAKVVGFDIVFAETDRTSPATILNKVSQHLPKSVAENLLHQVKDNKSLNYDLVLGNSISQIRSVLGYAFLQHNDGLKDPFAIPFPSINLRTHPTGISFESLSLLSSYRALINIPEISQATSEGFFNFIPDATGMVHKVPLFMQMDNVPYPSLALEMVRIGENEQQVLLHGSKVDRQGQHSILGIEIGTHLIPTDNFGQMSINYRGPTGTFPYVSAYDVLLGRSKVPLQNKYILFGTTAAGLYDLRSTPFSTIFPGVEIQATVIDNILSGDPLIHDPIVERGLTFILMIVGGLLLSALLAYTGPLTGGIGVLLFFTATLMGNYYFYFLDNVVVGLTYPLIVILTVFPVVTVFNYFFEGREKRFIDMAFSHYVSPQVVNQLKKNPHKLTLAGEEREMSILFSDIRGFTSISEQLEAVQLGYFMNKYLTAMSRIILDLKGAVDKFIGDAIMAIWNAPLDDDEHAANSVRTALTMYSQFLKLRPQWIDEGFPTFDIGIGINTGSVSVGNFGSEDRFDYTVIGDNVNLASRLEGLTKQYGVPIIISEFTRQAIGDKFYCRLLDRVRVVGKKQPVAIYEPICEGPPSSTVKDEIEQFNVALDAYFQADFTTAKHMIDHLYSLRKDLLYELYLKRIEQFHQAPPAAGWDGVTTFETK